MTKLTTASTSTSRWLQYFPGVRAALGYRRADFRADFLAGLSVAAVALPVGIAYAEIAGVPAVYGIYASILPLIAYAIFGSSRQLITGPDAATCLMVAAALGPLAAGNPDRYLELMIAITVITGSFHIIFGLCRFGFLANFLSHPILIGYLNGVSLIILVGQFPKIFGYQSEASTFFEKTTELAMKAGSPHYPTLLLGLGALAMLIAFKKWAPRVPAALVVAICSILAVKLFELQNQGVHVLGEVPAGFPKLHLMSFDPERFKILVQHAAGIALISFTSGILTAKSFANRNRYDIDANQELIAFGACNIASGLFQGFPVTGADSRTAVSNAMGGKTQLVGIVAGLAILVFLLFFTAPLAFLPNAALAAIIAVVSVGLFDFGELKELYRASRRELIFSLVTTAGVLIFDVLPAVFLAIMLTLMWMLLVASQPYTAVLGQIPGVTGFHDTSRFTNAVTIPGLLLFRWDGNLLFFNAEYFKDRLTAEIARSSTPVEWVVVDASPVNHVDITALHKLVDLREQLADQGVTLLFARVKTSIWRFFAAEWLDQQPRVKSEYRFNTLASAVDAFQKMKQMK